MIRSPAMFPLKTLGGALKRPQKALQAIGRDCRPKWNNFATLPEQTEENCAKNLNCQVCTRPDCPFYKHGSAANMSTTNADADAAAAPPAAKPAKADGAEEPREGAEDHAGGAAPLGHHHRHLVSGFRELPLGEHSGDFHVHSPPSATEPALKIVKEVALPAEDEDVERPCVINIFLDPSGARGPAAAAAVAADDVFVRFLRDALNKGDLDEPFSRKIEAFLEKYGVRLEEGEDGYAKDEVAPEGRAPIKCSGAPNSSTLSKLWSYFFSDGPKRLDELSAEEMEALRRFRAKRRQEDYEGGAEGEAALEVEKEPGHDRRNKYRGPCKKGPKTSGLWPDGGRREFSTVRKNDGKKQGDRFVDHWGSIGYTKERMERYRKQVRNEGPLYEHRKFEEVSPIDTHLLVRREAGRIYAAATGADKQKAYGKRERLKRLQLTASQPPKGPERQGQPSKRNAGGSKEDDVIANRPKRPFEPDPSCNGGKVMKFRCLDWSRYSEKAPPEPLDCEEPVKEKLEMIESETKVLTVTKETKEGAERDLEAKHLRAQLKTTKELKTIEGQEVVEATAMLIVGEVKMISETTPPKLAADKPPTGKDAPPVATGAKTETAGSAAGDGKPPGKKPPGQCLAELACGVQVKGRSAPSTRGRDEDPCAAVCATTKPAQKSGITERKIDFVPPGAPASCKLEKKSVCAFPAAQALPCPIDYEGAGPAKKLDHAPPAARSSTPPGATCQLEKKPECAPHPPQALPCPIDYEGAGSAKKLDHAPPAARSSTPPDLTCQLEKKPECAPHPPQALPCPIDYEGAGSAKKLDHAPPAARSSTPPDLTCQLEKKPECAPHPPQALPCPIDYEGAGPGRKLDHAPPAARSSTPPDLTCQLEKKPECAPHAPQALPCPIDYEGAGSAKKLDHAPPAARSSTPPDLTCQPEKKPECAPHAPQALPCPIDYEGAGSAKKLDHAPPAARSSTPPDLTCQPEKKPECAPHAPQALPCPIDYEGAGSGRKLDHAPPAARSSTPPDLTCQLEKKPECAPHAPQALHCPIDYEGAGPGRKLDHAPPAARSSTPPDVTCQLEKKPECAPPAVQALPCPIDPKGAEPGKKPDHTPPAMRSSTLPRDPCADPKIDSDDPCAAPATDPSATTRKLEVGTPAVRSSAPHPATEQPSEGFEDPCSKLKKMEATMGEPCQPGGTQMRHAPPKDSGSGKKQEFSTSAVQGPSRPAGPGLPEAPEDPCLKLKRMTTLKGPCHQPGKQVHHAPPTGPAPTHPTATKSPKQLIDTGSQPKKQQDFVPPAVHAPIRPEDLKDSRPEPGRAMEYASVAMQTASCFAEIKSGKGAADHRSQFGKKLEYVPPAVHGPTRLEDLKHPCAEPGKAMEYASVAMQIETCFAEIKHGKGSVSSRSQPGRKLEYVPPAVHAPTRPEDSKVPCPEPGKPMEYASDGMQTASCFAAIKPGERSTDARSQPGRKLEYVPPTVRALTLPADSKVPCPEPGKAMEYACDGMKTASCFAEIKPGQGSTDARSQPGRKLNYVPPAVHAPTNPANSKIPCPEPGKATEYVCDGMRTASCFAATKPGEGSTDARSQPGRKLDYVPPAVHAPTSPADSKIPCPEPGKATEYVCDGLRTASCFAEIKPGEGSIDARSQPGRKLDYVPPAVHAPTSPANSKIPCPEPGKATEYVCDGMRTASCFAATKPGEGSTDARSQPGRKLDYVPPAVHAPTSPANSKIPCPEPGKATEYVCDGLRTASCFAEIKPGEGSTDARSQPGRKLEHVPPAVRASTSPVDSKIPCPEPGKATEYVCDGMRTASCFAEIIPGKGSAELRSQTGRKLDGPTAKSPEQSEITCSDTPAPKPPTCRQPPCPKRGGASEEKAGPPAPSVEPRAAETTLSAAKHLEPPKESSAEVCLKACAKVGMQQKSPPAAKKERIPCSKGAKIMKSMEFPKQSPRVLQIRMDHPETAAPISTDVKAIPSKGLMKAEKRVLEGDVKKFMIKCEKYNVPAATLLTAPSAIPEIPLPIKMETSKCDIKGNTPGVASAIWRCLPCPEFDLVRFHDNCKGLENAVAALMSSAPQPKAAAESKPPAKKQMEQAPTPPTPLQTKAIPLPAKEPIEQAPTPLQTKAIPLPAKEPIEQAPTPLQTKPVPLPAKEPIEQAPTPLQTKPVPTPAKKPTEQQPKTLPVAAICWEKCLNIAERLRAIGPMAPKSKKPLSQQPQPPHTAEGCDVRRNEFKPAHQSRYGPDSSRTNPVKRMTSCPRSPQEKHGRPEDRKRRGRRAGGEEGGSGRTFATYRCEPRCKLLAVAPELLSRSPPMAAAKRLSHDGPYADITTYKIVKKKRRKSVRRSESTVKKRPTGAAGSAIREKSDDCKGEPPGAKRDTCEEFLRDPGKGGQTEKGPAACGMTVKPCGANYRAARPKDDPCEDVCERSNKRQGPESRAAKPKDDPCRDVCERADKRKGPETRASMKGDPCEEICRKAKDRTDQPASRSSQPTDPCAPPEHDPCRTQKDFCASISAALRWDEQDCSGSKADPSATPQKGTGDPCADPKIDSTDPCAASTKDPCATTMKQPTDPCAPPEHDPCRTQKDFCASMCAALRWDEQDCSESKTDPSGTPQKGTGDPCADPKIDSTDPCAAPTKDPCATTMKEPGDPCAPPEHDPCRTQKDFCASICAALRWDEQDCSGSKADPSGTPQRGTGDPCADPKIDSSDPCAAPTKDPCATTMKQPTDPCAPQDHDPCRTQKDFCASMCAALRWDEQDCSGSKADPSTTPQKGTGDPCADPKIDSSDPCAAPTKDPCATTMKEPTDPSAPPEHDPCRTQKDFCAAMCTALRWDEQDCSGSKADPSATPQRGTGDPCADPKIDSTDPCAAPTKDPCATTMKEPTDPCAPPEHDPCRTQKDFCAAMCAALRWDEQDCSGSKADPSGTPQKGTGDPCADPKIDSTDPCAAPTKDPCATTMKEPADPCAPAARVPCKDGHKKKPPAACGMRVKPCGANYRAARPMEDLCKRADKRKGPETRAAKSKEDPCKDVCERGGKKRGPEARASKKTDPCEEFCRKKEPADRSAASEHDPCRSQKDFCASMCAALRRDEQGCSGSKADPGATPRKGTGDPCADPKIDSADPCAAPTKDPCAIPKGDWCATPKKAAEDPCAIPKQDPCCTPEQDPCAPAPKRAHCKQEPCAVTKKDHCSSQKQVACPPRKKDTSTQDPCATPTYDPCAPTQKTDRSATRKQDPCDVTNRDHCASQKQDPCPPRKKDTCTTSKQDPCDPCAPVPKRSHCTTQKQDDCTVKKKDRCATSKKDPCATSEEDKDFCAKLCAGIRQDRSGGAKKPARPDKCRKTIPCAKRTKERSDRAAKECRKPSIADIAAKIERWQREDPCKKVRDKLAAQEDPCKAAPPGTPPTPEDDRCQTHKEDPCRRFEQPGTGTEPCGPPIADPKHGISNIYAGAPIGKVAPTPPGAPRDAPPAPAGRAAPAKGGAEQPKLKPGAKDERTAAVAKEAMAKEARDAAQRRKDRIFCPPVSGKMDPDLAPKRAAAQPQPATPPKKDDAAPKKSVQPKEIVQTKREAQPKKELAPTKTTLKAPPKVPPKARSMHAPPVDTKELTRKASDTGKNFLAASQSALNTLIYVLKEIKSVFSCDEAQLMKQKAERAAQHQARKAAEGALAKPSEDDSFESQWKKIQERARKRIERGKKEIEDEARKQIEKGKREIEDATKDIRRKIEDAKKDAGNEGIAEEAKKRIEEARAKVEDEARREVDRAKDEVLKRIEGIGGAIAEKARKIRDETDDGGKKEREREKKRSADADEAKRKLEDKARDEAKDNIGPIVDEVSKDFERKPDDKKEPDDPKKKKYDASRRSEYVQRVQDMVEELRRIVEAEAPRARQKFDELRRTVEEEGPRHLEEAKRRLEEAKQLVQTEGPRKAEEARRKLEEVKRLIEAEAAKKMQQAAPYAEEAKRKLEELRKLVEAEAPKAKQKLEELRRVVEKEGPKWLDQARGHMEEMKRLVERELPKRSEEAKRKLEEIRRVIEKEAPKKAEAASKYLEEAKRRLEEFKRAIETQGPKRLEDAKRHLDELKRTAVQDGPIYLAQAKQRIEDVKKVIEIEGPKRLEQADKKLTEVMEVVEREGPKQVEVIRRKIEEAQAIIEREGPKIMDEAKRKIVEAAQLIEKEGPMYVDQIKHKLNEVKECIRRETPRKLEEAKRKLEEVKLLVEAKTPEKIEEARRMFEKAQRAIEADVPKRTEDASYWLDEMKKLIGKEGRSYIEEAKKRADEIKTLIERESPEWLDEAKRHLNELKLMLESSATADEMRAKIDEIKGLLRDDEGREAVKQQFSPEANVCSKFEDREAKKKLEHGTIPETNCKVVGETKTMAYQGTGGGPTDPPGRKRNNSNRDATASVSKRIDENRKRLQEESRKRFDEGKDKFQMAKKRFEQKMKRAEEESQKRPGTDKEPKSGGTDGGGDDDGK